MHDEILSFIRDELLRGADAEVTVDTSLFSAQVLDSLCLMELVTFIEERAGFKVRPVDLVFENFDSVSAMIRFIERKTRAKGAPAGRDAAAER
jgi:acyl carrier protein